MLLLSYIIVGEMKAVAYSYNLSTNALILNSCFMHDRHAYDSKLTLGFECPSKDFGTS